MKRKTQRQTRPTSFPVWLIVALLALAGIAAWVVYRPVDITVERLLPAEYQADFVLAAKPHVLLDVRTPAEYASGHIPGAINIAVEELAQRLSEVPSGQPVVVYCRSGNRSAEASGILGRAGYGPIYDLGGIVEWSAQGLPIQ